MEGIWMEEKFFSLNQYRIRQETKKSLKNKRLEMYQPDFKQFEMFCDINLLPINFNSLELYLHDLITVRKVRLSTFNRRLSGAKYWLSNKGMFLEVYL